MKYLRLQKISEGKYVGAAISEISISVNFVWFATDLCALKEEKQDTSHIILPQKKANEIGNLTLL
jgi:hypothetical protein